MSDLIKVAPGALAVGKPLPWPVYDAAGNLLVSQGYVITSENQLDKLYRGGLFFPARHRRETLDEDAPQGARISPFAEYAGLLEDLEQHLQLVLEAHEGAQGKLLGLARRIHKLCLSDADACIALVHIYAVDTTPYEQTLFYAIICQQIALALDLDGKETVALLAAALTANMALLPFQDKLNRSRQALSDTQRQIIRKHPQLGASALQKAGVSNPLWLQIVTQHHECTDGSGYPAGLKGEAIHQSARILAVAERYIAMITRRAYRQRHPADQALMDIRRTATDPLDRQVADAFLRAMTRWPPGALVQLANGETAVVTHRPRNNRPPRIKAIIGASGSPFHGGFNRDAGDTATAIDRLVVPDMLPALNLAELWNYR